MDTYLDMLQDSLEKKLDILEKIAAYQKEEMEMLKVDGAGADASGQDASDTDALDVDAFDMDAFDRNVADKVALAEGIDKLDDGFERVYDRIRDEMLENKEKYAVSIRKLQDMIGEITEKNASIQAQERRIKQAVDSYTRRKSAALRQKRDNGKAARSYYNNMKKLNYVDSQFLDKKK